MIGGADDALDDVGKVCHFQLMFFARDVKDGVGRGEGHAALSDDVAAVVLVRNPMYGHARLGISGGFDRFVHVKAVHALASMLGQEGGMQINHTVTVSLDEPLGYHEQEACQHDEVDVITPENVKCSLLVGKCGLVDDTSANTQPLSTAYGRGIRPVADYKAYLDAAVMGEMTDNVFAVGALTGHEDGYACHEWFCLSSFMML